MEPYPAFRHIDTMDQLDTSKLSSTMMKQDDSLTTPTSTLDDSCSSLSSSRHSSWSLSITSARTLPERPADDSLQVDVHSASCSEPANMGAMSTSSRTPAKILPEDLLDTTNVEALSKVLASYKRRHGKDSVQAAHVYNFIGNAHFRNHDYQDALDAYKQAVQCAPGDHLGDSYANMGTVYWTIGNVDEAIAFLKRAHDVHEYIAVGRQQDPMEDLSIAAVAHQLGIAYTLKARYRKALRQFALCQDIRERSLPPNHVDIARVLDATGKVYALRKLPGDLQAALRCHEEAFHIKHSIPKRRRHPAILITTLSAISHVHVELGDFEAAIYSNKLLLKTQKKLLCMLRPHHGSVLGDIRETFATLWRLYQTIQDFDQAKCIRREACLFLNESEAKWSDER